MLPTRRRVPPTLCSIFLTRRTLCSASSLSVSESAQRICTKAQLFNPLVSRECSSTNGTLTAPNSASRAASIDRKSSVDNESRCARSARSWLPSARLIAPNESELGWPAADGAAALAGPCNRQHQPQPPIVSVELLQLTELRSCSLSFRLSSLERSRSLLKRGSSHQCSVISALSE